MPRLGLAGGYVPQVGSYLTRSMAAWVTVDDVRLRVQPTLLEHGSRLHVEPELDNPVGPQLESGRNQPGEVQHGANASGHPRG